MAMCGVCIMTIGHGLHQAMRGGHTPTTHGITAVGIIAPAGIIRGVGMTRGGAVPIGDGTAQSAGGVHVLHSILTIWAALCGRIAPTATVVIPLDITVGGEVSFRVISAMAVQDIAET